MRSARILAALAAFAAAASAHAITFAPHVAKNPADVGVPVQLRPGAATPQHVAVKLTAREIIADLAPGKPFRFWTWDGTVPGPMIRAMEGDTLDLTVCNDAGNFEPHNVDFHAVLGPGGGAAVTNVAVGQCKTASFKLTHAGAYIYHCAGEGMPWEHLAHGMYGLIMVEPKGGLPLVSQEFYVGQSDWYVTDHVVPDSRLPGQLFFDLDQAKAANEFPVTHYTFNGHTQALGGIHKLLTMQNDSVRFFFVTGGPNVASNWHIIGTIFDRVLKGDPTAAPERNEETVVIPPGSAAIFELTTPVPGKYLLVDHALYRVTKGAAGVLQVMGTPDPTCNPVTGAVVDPGSWPLPIYSPPTCGSGH